MNLDFNSLKKHSIPPLDALDVALAEEEERTQQVKS